MLFLSQSQRLSRLQEVLILQRTHFICICRFTIRLTSVHSALGVVGSVLVNCATVKLIGWFLWKSVMKEVGTDWNVTCPSGAEKTERELNQFQLHCYSVAIDQASTALYNQPSAVSQ